jgi:hypothetical protein
MNESDQQKYFEKAVSFIGEDWLEERDKHFETSDTHKNRPRPVQQYHRGLRDLDYVDDEFEEHFPETTSATLEFISLGRYIRALEDSGTIVDPDDYDVIETDISTRFTHRLRDRSEYEKAAYEIRTGGIYAQQGYTVQFIEESDSKKTPDILLRTPFKVFIECKRVDTLGGEEKKQQNITSALTNRTKTHIAPGHVALYEFDRPPQRDEISAVLRQIPQEVRGFSATFELGFGAVTLYNLNRILDPWGYVWLLDTDQKTVSDTEDVFDIYISPLVERVYGDGTTHSDLYTNIHADCGTTSILKVYSDFKYSAAPSAVVSDDVGRVARQVDRAREKFGKDSPNIVHIDTPFSVDKAESNVERLREAIGGELASTRRVTAVTVTLPVTETSSQGVEKIRHTGVSLKHLNPYTELPESFDLLGTDIT